MSMTWLLQAILVEIVAVAIVGSILVFLRKKLTPKAPLAAALVGVIVTIAVVGVAAYASGLDPGAPICLVLGTFVGFVAVQPRPRETRYLLRGLALASGSVSLYAALEPDLLAVIFGIGVSGLLWKLSASDERVSEVDGRAV